ncbi:DUF11 domain-containing protein [Nostoc sp. FACHB-152]|uniref:DUF11 domain-containing protein n=1 Tax=unclassified Nostoc TaxID=2593658 RepID=UPI001687EF64|nr:MULTISPECIES: DUF11 domain-containing protein [unclassified Nostoc]MBD2450400.1 DUF11 domain-containing protein [Nostoc sp. FACHB-152]MBD2471621.1 DUF11 domain-containing protein [Nostoc sp. FACHB-145]
MKQLLITGIGTILILGTASFITYLPGVIHGLQSNSAVAQNTQNKQALKLILTAEKQVLLKDKQGKQKVIWQALKDKQIVKPGDILRYTLTGENTSDRPLKNIILNQPISQGMIYILKSANFIGNAKITYSIDGGQSFSENPTIKIPLPNGNVETKSAPASAYTSIRFYTPNVAAKTTVKATYQTQVR